MPELKAEYFWSQQPAEGEMCSHCKVTIQDIVFIPVMQVGKTEDLNFKDIDLQLCATCYHSLES